MMEFKHEDDEGTTIIILDEGQCDTLNQVIPRFAAFLLAAGFYPHSIAKVFNEYVEDHQEELHELDYLKRSYYDKESWGYEDESEE